MAIQPKFKPTVEERVTEFVAGFAAWEDVIDWLKLLLGLGFLSFVAGSWAEEFVRRGSYVLAAALAALGVVLAGATLVRIPIALLIVFGGTAIAAVFFFTGHLALLLP